MNQLDDPKLRLLFGLRELEIIRKQQNNVKLSQSEKNRISGSIRHKIEAAKSIQNIHLSKGFSVKSEITTAIRQILATKYGKRINRIFLFGSQVDGRARLDSDIDLAIDLKTRKPFTAVTTIGAYLSKRIDLSILDTIKFKKKVIKYGKIVYSATRKNRIDSNISLRYRRFSQIQK